MKPSTQQPADTGKSSSEGSPWAFRFLVGLITLGVLGLILKVAGVF